MGKMFSPRGELILVKHVLLTISLHVFATLGPSKMILDKIESLLLVFFGEVSQGLHKEFEDLGNDWLSLWMKMG